MSARKSSHRTIFLIVSSGSPLALIASSLRSISKKPVCPMTRSFHPPMVHCNQRVRFAATWREEFFEVPLRLFEEQIRLMNESGYVADLDKPRSKEEFAVVAKGKKELEETIKALLESIKEELDKGTIGQIDVHQFQSALSQATLERDIFGQRAAGA